MKCVKEEISVEDSKTELNENKSKYEKNIEDENTYKIYINLGKFFFMNEINEYIKISKIQTKLSNSTIDIKIKRERDIKRKNNENRKDIYYLTCFYKIKKSNEVNKDKNDEYSFKDEDILLNGIDSKTRGFLFLINELTTSNCD